MPARAGRADAARPYRLVRPCPNCPFRTDVPPYLRTERAREISRSIRDGGEFHCHQTTVEDPEDDSALIADRTSAVCAGSLIVQEKEGSLGQVTRIMERLGIYDPTALDMDSPVYPSLSGWVAAVAQANGEGPETVTDPLTGETLELEHCGIVGPDCEDPAGFMAGSGVAENDEPPTCSPLEGCHACGTPVCGACRSKTDETLCCYCGGDEE